MRTTKNPTTQMLVPALTLSLVPPAQLPSSIFVHASTDACSCVSSAGVVCDKVVGVLRQHMQFRPTQG